MKRIKILIVFVTFTLAITGVVLAKTNEKKRRLQTTAYYLKSDGITWTCVTFCVATIGAQGSCTAAGIIDCNGVTVSLYASQSTSNPAAFTKP